jgi:hypothetical protein
MFFLSSLPNLLNGCHADLDRGGLDGEGRRPGMARPSSLRSPTNDDGGLTLDFNAQSVDSFLLSHTNAFPLNLSDGLYVKPVVTPSAVPPLMPSSGAKEHNCGVAWV